MTECYNLRRIPPETPKKELYAFWYQCMICYSSNYTEEKELDSPSSTVCKSPLCRMEFALLYSNTEQQFKENLESIIRMKGDNNEM